MSGTPKDGDRFSDWQKKGWSEGQDGSMRNPWGHGTSGHNGPLTNNGGTVSDSKKS